MENKQDTQQQTTQENNGNVTNWLDIEKQNLETTGFTGDVLPGLRLETGKITTFEVDFSNQFGKWTDGKVIKKIIPVMHKNEKKNLWLNIKNPLYKEIIDRGTKGQRLFKVSTVGTQAETRYTVVDED